MKKFELAYIAVYLLGMALLVWANDSPKQQVPGKVVVRGETYLIVERQNPNILGMPMWGITHFDTKIVEVKSDLSCEEKQRILTHELLHLATNFGSFNDVHLTLDDWLQGSGLERTPMDEGLAAIARGNPEVWKWISEGCK